MIVVDNLSKRFGKQLLFDKISFKINRRERVGVVGRNGHGKTTLFRLITGQEEADSGTVAMPKNYRIGYVEQQLSFTEPDILREASKALPPDGRDQKWKVEKVLAGLGFEKEALSRHPSELSGGYQVRLNLAKVLLGDYQMLLLDEPNNYLDITSIRWLVRFLVSWPGELLLITHDRGFMDQVVTHTLGIHRKKARKIAGDTEKYYSQIAMDEEVYEKTRINDERKRKEMDIFISRFRAKARLAGLVQSRIKTMARMEKRDRLDKLKTLDFAFAEKPFHHKYAMDVSGVSFSYDPEKPLIKDFSLSVGARDRVFIVGPNGKGKTTLLKLMAGALAPREGRISLPQSAAPGYFEQTNISSLSDTNTVLEEIAGADPECDNKQARAISGFMLFEGEDALKKIGVLSGGEKSRVVLGKLIASPLNLLLLDEPTNHLDLESSDALLAAIDNFDGAVVMVTHNEMFLHALAERLIVFQGGGITVHEGDYQSFLDKIGWGGEDRRAGEGVRSPGPEGEARPSPRDMRRLRSELVNARSRALKPLEKRISEIEKEIEERDRVLQELNEGLILASQNKDGTKVVELSMAMHDGKTAVDSLFVELDGRTREMEDIRMEFDQKMACLGGEEGTG